MSVASVGVVVLNYDGGELTLDCLRSITRSGWPADRLHIVLVDNASADNVVERVREELPSVRVIESPVNRGFAGGCNLGIRALGASVDFVALVNNDATVDASWLDPLVATLDADPRLGAAIPKIRFAGTFVDVSLTVPTHRRRGDKRDLGALVSGARVDGVDVWDRIQRVHGLWGADPREEWTAGEALVRVPVDPANPGGTVALRLASDRPAHATLTSGPSEAAVELTKEPRWCEVSLSGASRHIINNIGTELNADGYGVDRGYLEPDDGHYDEPCEIFAWCGAGALLRRSYLDDIGLFDERLFLYYEDLELAWRGNERGWRYRSSPKSVIDHVHAATSGEGSALKEYYNERNRLLVLTRHADGSVVRHALSRFVLITLSYVRRDVFGALRRGERPDTRIVRRRLRAFAGYLRRAPSMCRTRLVSRRSARRDRLRQASARAGGDAGPS